MSSWLFLNSGKGDAAFNMALDETLLENVSQIGKPVLRFYGWTEPSATFGYFQNISDVERATHLRPLIRRPTGGGIVPHDADWTYSFVAPPTHEWHSLVAIESYRRIHEWIQSALAKLKIETELAKMENGKRKTEKSRSRPASAATSECFVGHEKFDLLWRGKKIAGAAQRRNKFGLLIQGSIQNPAGEKSNSFRAQFENAMREIAGEKFGVEWENLSIDENLSARAGELTRQKYSQAAHNRKR